MLEAEKDHIDRAKEGDSAAFGQLYDHYVPRIYRFIVLKVGTRHEAEDLTHEVFLKAWQKLPTFQVQGYPFSSWLYKIARNKVIDYYRTKKQNISLDLIGDALEEEFLKLSSPEDLLDVNIEMSRVKEALRLLTQDQQEVVQMRFIEELSPQEIAQILNKKEGTVRIIQHRAMSKLKDLLKQ